MTKITDDNDNLIEVSAEQKAEIKEAAGLGDECVKTPGGFCKIDVDLAPDVIWNLLRHWVDANLHPASQEVFHETRVLEDPANDPAGSLYDAIVNDVIIDALTQQIERQESEIDAAATDV